MDLKTFVSDIRTYRIMSGNKNYYNRLYEAYSEIKRLNIRDYEDFSTREELRIGAFTYGEITIFDIIKNEEYQKLLEDAWFNLHNQTEEYRKDERLGDKLASWGTLGETPFRDQMIAQGHVIDRLTPEEQTKHYGR